MKEIKGILDVVAKTAGVKITGNKDYEDTWINPTLEAKNKADVGALRRMKGNKVIIEVNDEGGYNKILIYEGEETPVPIEEVEDAPDELQGAKKAPEGVSPENIITLQGKKFITHAGLLEVAHQKGLKSIETVMLTQPELGGGEETVVFKAIVTMCDKNGMETKFTGHGDANKDNVNSMIVKHKIRMAETRAVNRALRFATNIGMCSAEELGGDK